MILLAAALAAEPLTLDLPAAVDAAWQQAASARVADARLQRASAQGGLRLDDPQFRVRAKELGSKLDPIQWTFRLRQDLDDVLSAGPQSKARRFATEVAQEERLVVEERVRIETVRRFDGVRLLEAEAALANQELELLNKRVEIVTKRLAAGVEFEAEMVDAAFDRAVATRRLSLVEHTLRSARAQLLALLGEPADRELVLEGPSLRQTVEAPLNTRAEHLEARVADVRVEQAVLQKRAAVAARIPFLDWVQGQVVTEAGKVPSYGVSLGVSVPLFSLLDRSVTVAERGIAVREAEVVRLEQEHKSNLLRHQIVLDSVRTAIRELDAAAESARSVLVQHQARLTPDQKLSFEAKLLGERRRLLRLLDDGLDARRRLEAPVMGTP